MNLQVDLHLHTTASDGRWPPEQLVDELQRLGIGLFSVTDHDALGSVARAAELARERGLRFVPGVELSARSNGQLHHLLGYGFDLHDPALQRLVAANNARLLGASDEAVRELARAGWPISLDEYDAYTYDRRRGGWKALNFLIDQGICQGAHSYFNELFAEIRHPQAEFPSPADVVATVRGAGGTVVLAHPGAGFYNGAGTELLDPVIDAGVEGLECYSYHHDPAATARFVDYCRRRDLLITGGSDCHGGFVGRPLGQPPVWAADLKLGALEAWLDAPPTGDSGAG